LTGQPLLDNPIDLPLFVNRAPQLRAATEAATRGINALVFGQRGAGKTSFLHRVAHELRNQDVESVYIPGQLLAQTATGLLESIQYQLSGPRPLTISADMLRPIPEGERILREVRSLGGALQGRDGRAVVLLDEMPNRDEARTLFARLRDELWKLPIVWIVATNEPDSDAFTKPPADAFFGRMIKLGGLSQEQSLQLLRARLPELDPGTAAALAKQSGGNPRSLISLAQDVVISGQTPKDVVDGARDLQVRLSRLGDPAQRLYAELESIGQASASDPYLLERLGWKRARAQQVLAKLEAAGLVTASAEIQKHGAPRKVYRPNRIDLT